MYKVLVLDGPACSPELSPGLLRSWSPSTAILCQRPAYSVPGCYLLCSLFVRRRCSERKPDSSRSPYSSEDSNKPWPTAISPIPRATTNWDAAPSMEMTEGGSTNTLVDKKRYSNGLVSLTFVLFVPDRPLNPPLVCSVLPHRVLSAITDQW